MLFGERQHYFDGVLVISYTKEHINSVREMSNGSGSIVWQQSYGPFREPTTIVLTTATNFGFAGYFFAREFTCVETGSSLK